MEEEKEKDDSKLVVVHEDVKNRFKELSIIHNMPNDQALEMVGTMLKTAVLYRAGLIAQDRMLELFKEYPKLKEVYGIKEKEEVGWLASMLGTQHIANALEQVTDNMMSVGHIGGLAFTAAWLYMNGFVERVQHPIENIEDTDVRIVYGILFSIGLYIFGSITKQLGNVLGFTLQIGQVVKALLGVFRFGFSVLGSFIMALSRFIYSGFAASHKDKEIKRLLQENKELVDKVKRLENDLIIYRMREKKS